MNFSISKTSFKTNAAHIYMRAKGSTSIYPPPSFFIDIFDCFRASLVNSTITLVNSCIGIVNSNASLYNSNLGLVNSTNSFVNSCIGLVYSNPSLYNTNHGLVNSNTSFYSSKPKTARAGFGIYGMFNIHSS